MGETSFKPSLFLIFTLLFQTQLETANGKCLSGVFDAITRTSDGNTYAFQGGSVVKITPDGNGVSPGYPKWIGCVFPGLPSDVDAAFHWDENGKTFFFKGCEYYRYSGTTPDSGYPKSISENWEGVPCDIDAIVVWGKNGKPYFFKGDEYYRFDPNAHRVDSGYPISIAKGWVGLPSPVDAAFQWQNGRTYLFTGEEYYRWDDTKDRVDAGYPLTTTAHWLGCTDPSPVMADMCNFE